jgi:hypothetical protein
VNKYFWFNRTMQKICDNPKCDYYRGRRCFAKRCTQSCRNPECEMFGQDHFARMCRLTGNRTSSLQYGNYQSPGERCHFQQQFQQNSAQPLHPQAEQFALNFFDQTLSNVTQNHQAPTMLANHLMGFPFQNSLHQNRVQNQESTRHLDQAFNPPMGLPFSPFFPSAGGNPMPHQPSSGGWPPGQY